MQITTTSPTQNTSFNTTLAPEMSFEIAYLDEMEEKISSLSQEAEMKGKLLYHYSNQATKLKMIYHKKGDKIYHSYKKLDWVSSGSEILAKQGKKLAEAHPFFKKKYTPKVALGREIERLDQMINRIKKDLTNLSSEKNHLIQKRDLLADKLKNMLTPQVTYT